MTNWRILLLTGWSNKACRFGIAVIFPDAIPNSRGSSCLGGSLRFGVVSGFKDISADMSDGFLKSSGCGRVCESNQSQQNYLPGSRQSSSFCSRAISE